MTKQELLQKPLEERRDYLVNLVKNKTHDFGMFSKAGGNKCKSFIIKCMKKIMSKKAMRRGEYEEYVSKEIQKISKQDKYGEIGDTAVREGIYYWLELAIEMAEYEWSDEFEYNEY